MIKILYRKFYILHVAFFFLFNPIIAQISLKEQLIPSVNPYDNYGTLYTHAFNRETGTLACVYSTGVVKSYNIYTRNWTTHAKINPDSEISIDISDDGYIFVCCLYYQSVLIDSRSNNGTLQTIDDAYFAAFIPRAKEIIMGENPTKAKENTLAIYSYPEFVYKKRYEISWVGKTQSDSAKFSHVKRYYCGILANSGKLEQMAHKRKGQITKTGEWAKHLRKDFRRIFWSKERIAEKKYIKGELDNNEK